MHGLGPVLHELSLRYENYLSFVRNKAGYIAQDAPSTRLKKTGDGRTDGRTDGHNLL